MSAAAEEGEESREETGRGRTPSLFERRILRSKGSLCITRSKRQNVDCSRRRIHSQQLELEQLIACERANQFEVNAIKTRTDQNKCCSAVYDAD